MANKKSSSKLHVVMFPWFAFDHFTPFLHLSKKLADKGHKISFLAPKVTLPKLTHLNHHPHLINFVPIVVPQVDGLPSGAETTIYAPFPLSSRLWFAFDQTQDQVKKILTNMKPDFVFYDMGYWVPAIARELGIKSVIYATGCAAWAALRFVPSGELAKDMTEEQLMQTPPGYPSKTVLPRPDEIFVARTLTYEFGGQWSLHKRTTTSMNESDAIAFRTCREIEGHFCDYLAQQYGKPVFPLGPVMPPKQATKLKEKWVEWLGNFETGSVVYCSFGSEHRPQKDQFQELLLGFELSGLPFLVALRPPHGCTTVEEAFPEGFEERLKGRGLVYGGWVPQAQILEHPSVGCFVSHCGFSSMWESLLSDCQLVLAPTYGDQILNSMLLANELKVAVELNKEMKVNDSRNKFWISKECLSNAIKSVMDKESEIAGELRSNHAKWKKIISEKDVQETHTEIFIQNLRSLIE